MQFRAKIESHGKTATGVEVPAEIVEALGKGNRPAVSVTINGHNYRSSIAVMGGRFLLGISAEVRSKAEVNAQEEIDIHIELDNQPRVVDVPADLQKALDRNAEARKYFEQLSYSNKLRYVLPIEQAKTGETRQRRVDTTIIEFQKAGRK